MKNFILIANKNCITYKEFFPLIKDRKVNIGYTHPGDFDQPEEDTYKSMQGLTRWFTTLSTASKPPLVLTATYDPEKYKRYDNYDAINVDKVKDIPWDYDGTMGVPITILDHNLDNVDVVDARDYTDNVLLKNKGTQLVKDADGKVDGRAVYPRVMIKKNFEINPEQFEIINLDRYVEDNPNYGHRFHLSGKETYARILIRRKK